MYDSHTLPSPSSAALQRKLRHPLRVAFSWTAPWVVLLASLLLLASNSSLAIPYGFHAGFVWLGGLALVMVLFFGLWRAAEYLPIGGQPRRGFWYSDGHLLAALVFWALFPPAWFFLEYYSVAHGLFQLPAGQDGPQQVQAWLASYQVYADLGSRVWAGAGALFLLVLAKAR